ncbi:MAG: hypothetical protein CVV33_05890 [Methanomicrobiales archaeon HGW-Methanomicrobiales-4]|nr:MAG: hypothetical protein CVV33_05890 [Methanomicrobiales archaeon HGW-Methanomicrobiales-4]
MRVKRCTRVLIAAFLILFFSSYILDQPGILAVSLFLWMFLAFRFFLFFSRLTDTAASVQIIRTIEKHITQQGGTSQIRIRISLLIHEGITGAYNEMIPSGVTIGTGVTMTPDMTSGRNEQILNYQIIPLTHGNILLPGGYLTVRDWFFEKRLNFSGTLFSGPVLRVQPSPLFVIKTNTDFFGRNETDINRVLHGQSIRTYRKYELTDDFRLIDWKLTAKHNTLYVREYTSLEYFPPFIIIDLPDEEGEYNQNDFSELVQGVTTVIEKTLKGGSGISLLIISGPNIIRSIFNEFDLPHCMTVIRECFHPHIRLHHLYRVRSRIDIRKELKKLQAAGNEDLDDDTSRYFSLLNEIYHHHLMDGGMSSFSSQLSRIFLCVRLYDISFFSLCDGDVSHIKEISRQARIHKIRFCIITPPGMDVFRINPRSRSLRGEIIEGFV